MKSKGIYKFFLILCIAGLAPVTKAAEQPYTATITAERQEAKTPQQVLQRLKEGNERFVSGKMKNRDLLTQATSTSTGQHPVAVVLNCMDSRASPEILFDQGIGDIFAIRIAGNVQNNDILGSMEFGTQLAGAKLIAVIGHTSCGAIQGACQQAKLGHLTDLLQKIQPAVEQASKEKSSKDCTKPDFIDQIAKDNVLLVMKQLQESSPVLQQLIKNGNLVIVGGIQDVSTGKVTFFDDQINAQK